MCVPAFQGYRVDKMVLGARIAEILVRIGERSRFQQVELLIGAGGLTKPGTACTLQDRKNYNQFSQCEGRLYYQYKYKLL